MKPITILLADDHTIVRASVRQLLELESDFEVVGEAQDGSEAVALAKKLQPDMVLMDITMPHLNGLEATRQVRKAVPTTKVLILSANSDDTHIKKATESGAVGYLLKETSAHDMCQAIREGQKGNPFFSPSVAKRMDTFGSKSSGRDGQITMKPVALTVRENEILKLIAEGNTNKQMAAELGIGLKTVEKHREHLMHKLNIHDTAGLTRYAIEAGIIESSVQLTIL